MPSPTRSTRTSAWWPTHDPPRAETSTRSSRSSASLRGLDAVPGFGEGIVASRVEVHTGTAKFYLSCDFYDGGAEIVGRVEFDLAVFDRQQADDLCHRLQRLLADGIADSSRRLSQLPLLDGEELGQVQASCREPEPLPAARSVVELILIPGQPDARRSRRRRPRRDHDLCRVGRPIGLHGRRPCHRRDRRRRRCRRLVPPLRGHDRDASRCPSSRRHLPSPRPDLSGGQARRHGHRRPAVPRPP